MPVRFLSDAELARLSGWPDEIADEDLVTYFALTGDDLGWLASTVRLENRLGIGPRVGDCLRAGGQGARDFPLAAISTALRVPFAW
jgi:hypothetical protein